MSSVILIVICYVYIYFFTTIDPQCTLPSNEYASLESDNGEVAPLCPFIISSGVVKGGCVFGKQRVHVPKQLLNISLLG